MSKVDTATQHHPVFCGQLILCLEFCIFFVFGTRSDQATLFSIHLKWMNNKRVAVKGGIAIETQTVAGYKHV